MYSKFDNFVFFFNKAFFYLVVTDSELIEYVNRKLAHGRQRVWADVQSRVRTFILSSDLSNFKYDDFITVLDIVKRYELFCKALFPRHSLIYLLRI